jgi:hypothetical protein
LCAGEIFEKNLFPFLKFSFARFRTGSPLA